MPSAAPGTPRRRTYDEHVVVGNPLGELYYNKYSLDKPSTQGKFHEAVAAYKRTFDEVRSTTTTTACRSVSC